MQATSCLFYFNKDKKKKGNGKKKKSTKLPS